MSRLRRNTSKLATASAPRQETGNPQPLAVIPNRKKFVRLTLWPLVAATFFMVSGGTYGTEDIVHGAGYGRGDSDPAAHPVALEPADRFHDRRAFQRAVRTKAATTPGCAALWEISGDFRRPGSRWSRRFSIWRFILRCSSPISRACFPGSREQSGMVGRSRRSGRLRFVKYRWRESGLAHFALAVLRPLRAIRGDRVDRSVQDRRARPTP